MNTNYSYQELSDLLEDLLETFELSPSFNPQQAVQDILNSEDYLVFED